MADVSVTDEDLKQAVIRTLDALPPEKVTEVYEFALFLQGRMMRPGLTTASASSLDALTGIVAWGGDAVVDTESLYDGIS